MVHHIYHTRGIILESMPSGEANRYYKIFTENLGLVGATAQAVREGKSKLRYVLQDFSTVHVDLVRGKDVWRITSAIEEQAFDLSENRNAQRLFLTACTFVARFLHGEGRENEVFTELYALGLFLKNNNVTSETLVKMELLVSLRLLFFLGYVDGAGYEQYLTPGHYSPELLESIETEQVAVRALVDRAVTSSQL